MGRLLHAIKLIERRDKRIPQRRAQADVALSYGAKILTQSERYAQHDRSICLSLVSCPVRTSH